MARRHAPRQLPSGKWRIRWRDEAGRPHSETYEKFEQAEAALRRHLVHRDDVRSGRAQPLSDKTLCELAAEWIEGRSEARQRDDRPHLNNHILPLIGELPVPQVQANLRLFIRHMEQKDAARPGQKSSQRVSPNTVMRVLATLRKLCNDCGYPLKVSYTVKRSPASGDIDDDEGEFEYITEPHDIVKFLGSCRQYQPEWFYVACALSIYAGLRAGEVAGLRRAAVDFKRGTIHVLRSYDGPTKSGKPRYIPLAPDLAEVLKAWFERTPGLYVVMINGAQATPKQTAGWARRVGRVCKRAGIEPIRFHGLRHTFASHLVMAGKSLYVVQKLLGHSTPMMTQRYAHLSPKDLARDPELHLSFAA